MFFRSGNLGKLKNRAYLSDTLPIKMIATIKEFAEYTRIPRSKLSEEAWGDFLIKYSVEIEEMKKNRPK